VKQALRTGIILVETRDGIGAAGPGRIGTSH
jgi:hypothetical protein